MRKGVRDSVVVITGASSGIGRATALEFARRGSALVLAARREEPLVTLAEECEALGARAIVRGIDVTDEAAVNDLTQFAVEQFGRIDVWVNNAAVTSFGPFESTPSEVFRRVIEVDLFGYVYGARAALAEFRKQKSGVLVNVGSMVSTLSEPYVSAYVTAKHAIRGFSQSLRQELELQGEKDIHVCLVMPATIDTPFFQHGANYSGRAAKAMPPVYPAHRVARTIVHLAEHPRREVFVGNAARVFQVLSLAAPGLTERLLATSFDRKHLYRYVFERPSSGNLFLPMRKGASVSGGWLTAPDPATKIARVGAGVAVAALLGIVGWRLRDVRRP